MMLATAGSFWRGPKVATLRQPLGSGNDEQRVRPDGGGEVARPSTIDATVAAARGNLIT